MPARGVGRIRSRPGTGAPLPGTFGNPRGIIRLRPQTWQRLAALRRPIVDSEGKLVGLESFDRLVDRLMEERTAAPVLRPTHGRRSDP